VRRARAAPAAAAALLAACGGRGGGSGDRVLVLPPLLREVSAIACVDEHTLACVQDERGAVLLVDLAGRAPPRSLPFGPGGDYEGLARAGDDWWVLRSDGRLLRLAARDGALQIAASIELPAGRGEWEALCHDAARGRLLAMPKRGSAAAGGARLRPIHAVALPAGTLLPEPIAVVDRDAVLARAAELGADLPARRGARAAGDRGRGAADPVLRRPRAAAPRSDRRAARCPPPGCRAAAAARGDGMAARRPAAGRQRGSRRPGGGRGGAAAVSQRR
jgi:hypothetical protein